MAVVAVALGALVGAVNKVAHLGDVSPLPPNSVGVVGPRGLVGDPVDLGGRPAALVSGAGSLWVARPSDRALVRIDPQTRRVIQTIADVGPEPEGLAVTGEDVWVASFGGSAVTRVSALANKVVDRIPVGNQPSAVVASQGEVWVANSGDNTVQRIDATTGKAGRPFPVGNGPAALALDGSTLWVANGRSGTLTRLDARTGERVSADTSVDPGPMGLAVTGTDVWVANQLSKTVSRVDKVTGQVARIAVEDGPSSLVVAPDGVWVANAYAGGLSRIDPATNAVTTLGLGSSPKALARVGAEVWAASGAFASQEHVGGTLTVVDDFEFVDGMADPVAADYPTIIAMLRQVYDGLVALSRPGGLSGQTILADLATSLPSPSDGGRTYVFTVRRGVHYSDGREVMASDFVLGFRRAVLRSGRGFFDGIVGATKCIDDRDYPNLCDLSRGVTADDASGRLTVHLLEPDPQFLYKLGALGPLVAPTPAGTPLTAVGRDGIPSTGPYLVGALAADKSLTLRRNPYFAQWSFAAQPAGYPDVIVHRVAGAADGGVKEVLAGVADLARVPYEQVAQTAAAHPTLTHIFDEANTDFLYVNTHLAPFDNVLVRRALNDAVDRRKLVDLYHGGSAVAHPSCQLLPPSFSSYHPYCPYQTGPADGPYQGPDLVRARQRVAQSGTLETPVTIHRLAVPSPNIWSAFPDYVATVLRDLGYRVDIADIPPEHSDKVLRDAAYDGYQLFTSLGWLADYDSASTFYDNLFSCRHVNISRYCNQAVEAVARQALDLEATDPGAALGLWAQVDRMLTDDGAFVTLGNRSSMEVVSTRVGNYQARTGLGAELSQLWVR